MVGTETSQLKTPAVAARRSVAAGIAVFATDESIAIDDLARLTEERGFESLWLPEHTHIPVVQETPHPHGGEVPREYRRMLDPFVALTAAAAATSRIRLGFGVCLLIQRDPIITAKAVATLDLLSGGRVLFGVGAGWNVEEMRNHGVNPGQRMGILRDRVEAMRTLWTDDEATYHGRHVRFDHIWSWPKPLQKPHPPILVGGNGATAEDRAFAYGDGWMPGLRGEDDVMLERFAALRERARTAGRPMEITVNNMVADPDRVRRYVDSGLVDRLLFYVPSAGREAVERHLDLVESCLDAAGASQTSAVPSWPRG